MMRTDSHSHTGAAVGSAMTVTLYFPAARVADALRALAAMAQPDETPEMTTIRLLATGEEVTVPFTAKFKHHPITLSVGGEVGLDTLLVAPFDDALRAWRTHHATREINGVEYDCFGYIFLTLRLGCLHASFAFTPATSSASRALVASAALRGRFRELLVAAGGLAGWLDTEDAKYRRLDDPAFTFLPEPEPPSSWENHPDGMATAVCRGLGHPTTVVDDLLRCRTTAVVGLARAARDGAVREVLPVLGDALEEAGCTVPEVLAHCRRADDHAGPCWIAEVLRGEP